MKRAFNVACPGAVRARFVRFLLMRWEREESEFILVAATCRDFVPFVRIRFSSPGVCSGPSIVMFST